MQAPGPGLTQEQVEQACRQRARPEPVTSGGRTYGQIVRANLFTFFNNILFVIGLALLALGRANDALVSAGVGLLNAFISAIQGIRAKRQLDALRSAYAVPTAETHAKRSTPRGET